MQKSQRGSFVMPFPVWLYAAVWLAAATYIHKYCVYCLCPCLLLVSMAIALRSVTYLSFRLHPDSADHRRADVMYIHRALFRNSSRYCLCSVSTDILVCFMTSAFILRYTSGRFLEPLQWFFSECYCVGLGLCD